MDKQACDVGVVGLGVMGHALVLNLAEHGISVAGYDADQQRARALAADAPADRVCVASSEAELADLLKAPRCVLMLVPAGPPVDSVLESLTPHLSAGDLVLDCGNSFYRDTDRRAATLGPKGIGYMGVGVSGGQHGARHGASLMAGGAREAYNRVRPVLRAVAATVDGEACLGYMGAGSAGHYVKMVHNGIEYGLMQLIAESYDIMHRGLAMSDQASAAVFARWNEVELGGYLMEITADILSRVDAQTGQPLVDVILGEAGQNYTGMWTWQDAMALFVPTPTIDAAVVARNLSDLEAERLEASRTIVRREMPSIPSRDTLLNDLRGALYAAELITYAQGMALIQKASIAHGYGTSMLEVTRAWRGGCIIRSGVVRLLDEAYSTRPDLANPLLHKPFADEVAQRQERLREVVSQAARMGLPAPAMSASLAYLDGYRSDRLPANLIQAQRDYFGAHTYERVDARGVFHTAWETD